MMSHPDHDIQERVLLSLLAFAKHSASRQSLKASGILSSIISVRDRYSDLSIDADEEYRDILKGFKILLADLEDSLAMHDEL